MLGDQGQLLGPGLARDPACDQGGAQVHVDHQRDAAGENFFLFRIARYLLEHPRAIAKFRKGGNLDVIKVYTDSDWAGFRKTR